MKINYDTTLRIRIVGIALSVVSLVLIFIRPFDFVLNTLLVYGFIIFAAIFMIVGQIMVLNVEPNEETETKHEQHEILYDIVTTAIVMTLFIAFYAIPFVLEHLL